MMALVHVQRAHAQASKNMTLLGQRSYAQQLSNLWGYAAGGKEYAIVGTETGVSIVDITIPSAPVQLQFISGVNTIWREVRTWDHYAYITNEGDDGLRIIDLSNLPGTVTYKDTLMEGMATTHSLHIDENGVLFLNGGPGGQQGIEMFDLSADPWRPTYLGGWHDRYVHDMYARNDTAYLAEINDGLFEILDVTNKSAPVLLGSKSYLNSFTHNTWLNDAGNVCFTTDELDSAYVYAWDITDPSDATQIDAIRSSVSAGMAIPHNVHVLNDFLIISYYKDGVNIVDAARPHNLIEVGYYDTSPLTGGGFDGVWGAHAYLPSGNIIAGDMSEGLFILGPTYKRGCYLEGIVTDSVTGLTIPGATITILSPVVTDLSDVDGTYAVGVADSGTYNVRYEKFGYVTKTVTYNLDNGVLVAGDVELAPLPRISYTINVIEAGTGTPIASAPVICHDLTSGSDLSYTTNASGIVNDPSFIPSDYDIIAGKWGYRTRSVTVTASGGSPSVTIELEKGYYDDYVLNFGWTNSSTATSGTWERGEPIGTYDFFGDPVAPEDDLTGDIGDQCYVTGNGGGGIGDDDVDGGSVVLTSPVMDLTTYVDPVVKYYRWFANTGGSGSPNDELKIEITNGTSSFTLRTITSPSVNWVQDTFHLVGLVPSGFINSTMRLRVTATDNPSGHVTEGAIDQFEVVDGMVAVAEPTAPNGVSLVVSPNPITSASQLAYDLGTLQGNVAHVELRDAAGRTVMVRQLFGHQGSVDLRFSGAAGVYHACLIVDGAVVKTARVLK
jgi:choice-of-anchor B domain-containing protein